MGAVENSARGFAALLQFNARFVGSARATAPKIRSRARCGKRVKTVWTLRDEFG
jgi:hypothetical protein